jgi:curved DNA-binding protein CbpA
MPSPPRTYYEILGLDRGATGAEIRDAYRRLARRYHPDVCSGVDAGRRFAELASAYEVLHDPRQRARYDASIGAGVPRQAAGARSAPAFTSGPPRRQTPRFLDEEPGARYAQQPAPEWRLLIFWPAASGWPAAPTARPRRPAVGGFRATQPAPARRRRTEVRWLD